MENIDNKNKINTMYISIWDLISLENEISDLVKSIWHERLKILLEKFYSYKLSQYLNWRLYQSIEKLEGIKELIESLKE